MTISFLMGWGSALFGATCPEMKATEFPAFAAASGAQRVVFFASWCGSCRARLAEVGPDDLLVGVFDEAQRIERLARKLKPNVRCVRGDDIAKLYGVNALPATVDLAAKH